MGVWFVSVDSVGGPSSVGCEASLTFWANGEAVMRPLITTMESHLSSWMTLYCYVGHTPPRVFLPLLEILQVNFVKGSSERPVLRRGVYRLARFEVSDTVS